MSFLIRNVDAEDLTSLQMLAKQFTLLNLPDEKSVLEKKIATSIDSFGRKIPSEDSEFLFVTEDLETKSIIGCSQVMAKHGTEKSPHMYFKVHKKERMSRDLGIGFIHQILRFKEDSDGPTEIGGLIVDSHYQRRPEKIGKQISLIRFLYMAMNKDLFQEQVLCELTAPLTSDGRSEFWEALGRRFTGMSYQEADRVSQTNKEFIQSLFPQEDIYFSLLDSKARLVMGTVGEKTKPAQYLLKKLGFQYLSEVDPFDGGPHYGANLEDISIVKNSSWATIAAGHKKTDSFFEQSGLIGWESDGKFRAVYSPIKEEQENNKIYVPENSMKTLDLSAEEKVCYSLIS